MKVLDCLTGQYSLVDDADHQAWSGFKWGQDEGGYICMDFKGKGSRKIRRYYLHRLIAHPGPGHQVHHKNRCRWDNRRENLECLTVEEHCRRHPGNRRLLAIAEAKRRAHAQWLEEEQLRSLMAEAEKA